MGSALFAVSSAASRLIAKLTSPSHRYVLIIVVIVWINILNLVIFHHRNEALGYLRSKIQSLNPLNNYDGHAIPQKLVQSLPVKLLLDEANIKPDDRRAEIHSSNYDDLLSKHTFEELAKLSFSDRCDAFFRNLYVQSDWKWLMDAPNRFVIDTEYEMPWEDYKNKYKDIFRERIALSQKKEPKKVEEKDIHDSIAKVYDGLKAQSRKDDKEMQEYIAIGRIFNKCYVTRDSLRVKQRLDRLTSTQAQLMSRVSNSRFIPTDEERKIGASKFPDCTDLETRVYPWLSFDYPVYERFSGTKSKFPPNMLDYIDTGFRSRNFRRDRQHISSKLTGNRPCWLNSFKNSLNGKGIVIPFTGDSFENIRSLIRLLRALKNVLPIQIISYGQLDGAIKEELTKVARDAVLHLPESFEKVSNVFEEPIMTSTEIGLEPQELWFVDASTMLVPEAKEKWYDFPITILATFASSFEEILLINPSTVLLKNPDYFFSLKEYEQNGAYFYRNRPMHKRKDSHVNFFKKMTPSLIDAVIFDIPILTAKSLDLPFFAGLREMQDPGVIVLDKDQHFASINSLLQLGTFWPASYRGNVSQELWLGLLVSGDESFHFNKYFPAALGENIANSGKAPRVCSAHTGHLDPITSKDVAWLTNGFNTCPATMVDLDKDLEKAFKWKAFKNKDDLAKFYKSTLDISVAVIPPFENIDSLKLENDEKNPSSPWNTEHGCQDMIFCANSEIGGSTKYGSNLRKGQHVEIDSFQKDLVAFYGDVWRG